MKHFRSHLVPNICASIGRHVALRSRTPSRRERQAVAWRAARAARNAEDADTVDDAMDGDDDC